jgi:hypothetical protein
VYWSVASWYLITFAFCFCGCGAGIVGVKRLPDGEEFGEGEFIPASKSRTDEPRGIRSLRSGDSTRSLLSDRSQGSAVLVEDGMDPSPVVQLPSMRTPLLTQGEDRQPNRSSFSPTQASYGSSGDRPRSLPRSNPNRRPRMINTSRLGSSRQALLRPSPLRRERVIDPYAPEAYPFEDDETQYYEDLEDYRSFGTGRYEDPQRYGFEPPEVVDPYQSMHTQEYRDPAYTVSGYGTR